MSHANLRVRMRGIRIRYTTESAECCWNTRLRVPLLWKRANARGRPKVRSGKKWTRAPDLGQSRVISGHGNLGSSRARSRLARLPVNTSRYTNSQPVRHAHTHAAHDWLRRRHETHCHRPSQWVLTAGHIDRGSQGQLMKWRYMARVSGVLRAPREYTGYEYRGATEELSSSRALVGIQRSVCHV